MMEFFKLISPNWRELSYGYASLNPYSNGTQFFVTVTVHKDGTFANIDSEIKGLTIEVSTLAS